MIANGADVKPASELSVAHIVDVAPTILYLMGQSLPDDLDGRVLADIISDEYLNATPIRFTAQSRDDRSGEVEFSPEENAEIIESLKNLGYIG